MKNRLIFSMIIAMAVICLIDAPVYAQSSTPNLEDIVHVGSFTQYTVTATGAGAVASTQVNASCSGSDKLIGVLMSKNITLPGWEGTSYWNVSIGTSHNAAMVVYSETSVGNRTVTIGRTLHARSEIIPNWSVLSQTAIVPTDLANILQYPLGINIELPRHYIDYSVPAATVVTSVITVSATYTQNTGGLPMVVTGEIAPVCITDPKWYYIGSMIYMTNTNPGIDVGSQTVDVNVGISLNGPNRLAAILSDTKDMVTETREYDHSWTVETIYPNGTIINNYYMIYRDIWYNPGAKTNPDIRKYCISRPQGQYRKIWDSGDNIYVDPCLIPEASGYSYHPEIQYWTQLSSDLVHYQDYQLLTLRTVAKGVTGSVSVSFRPVLIGTPPEQGSGTCEDNYVLAGSIHTDSVPAYDATPFLSGGQYGEAISLEAGHYYAIEIIDPAYVQGDSHPPANSYLSQITTLWQPGPVGGSVWYDPNELPNSCYQDLGLGRMRVYFYTDQTAYSPLYGIRAADPAGDWSNNSGELNYTVYNAIYTPTPSACEASYEVGNLLAQNIQVRADYRDGGYITPGNHPWQPNQTYMVELSGEPWFDDGSIPSHAVDVSIDGGATWHSIDDLIGEFCVVDTGYGQRRLYLTHLTGREYKIRAHDENDTYLQNSGYVSYSVYTATNYATSGSCSSMFTIGEELVDNTVNASLEDGIEIPLIFTPYTWYVVETLAPSYTDNGTPSGSADYTGANYAGREWVSLLDFPSASCSETTGIYQRIYYRAQYERYWIRASSMDPTWTNNDGDLHYRVYRAELANPTNPPPASCEMNYNQQRVLLSVQKIFSNNEHGINLTSLSEGLYAMESLDGPWMDNQSISYDLEYVSDESAFPLTPAGYRNPVECVVLLSDQKHVRAYINISHNDSRLDELLRVYDIEQNYADNTGTISVAIYRVTAAGDAPPVPEPPPSTICNSVCVRPDGILDVPAWLEYVRCAFSKFISFCPYHAAALESSIDAFNTREPFKTFNEIASLPKTIQQEFQMYQWDSPSGGGENLQQPTGLASAWYDILPNLPDDSPWNNGKITLTKPMSTTYSTMCTIELTEVIGSKLGAPVCFVLNVMNGIGAIKWMQFILDVVMLIILVLYIYQGWLKQGG